ncbi:MAG: hypothetical protein G01um10143_314 [Parcubacteria group bacterium Gr01-1014_3]|nr:MAG: hypothetical protein G01um10143_314 [Parcubacteria group bacterium Gr01-1014_3]
MKKEAFAERAAEKRDINEAAGEHLEKMAEFLSAESERLRSEGFPVDEDCRIDLREFEDLYSKEVLERDKEKVSKIEAGFENSQSEKIAELLEAVKTLVFNKFWFDGRLVAVRTSKFDDYTNGVDQLILDRDTFQPLAAVDTTLDWKSKLPKIMDKIQKGSVVKYGVGLSKDGVEKMSYTGLPVFIISLNGDEVLELARGIEAGELGEEGERLAGVVAEELSRQSQQLSSLTGGKLQSSYSSANKIFKAL